MSREQTRIAIIGAGWNGLTNLRRLRQHGYDAVLFERFDGIGGVWHRDASYHDLRMHGAAQANLESIEFPLLDELDPHARPSAAEVRRQLEAYCQHFGLHPAMHFRCEVQSIGYRTDQQDVELCHRDASGATVVETFDIVIHTHGFASPNVPEFRRSAGSTVEVLHC